MYFQITQKCNMSCKHCCFSMNKTGDDMAFETFKTILNKWYGIIQESSRLVTIGGGEPTLHPKFWDFIGQAALYGTPWLATNGSNKKDALKLCELAKKGAVAVALSLDRWHDPIDLEVVEAFSKGLTMTNYGFYKLMTNYCNPTDLREIRTVIIPYKGGRAHNIQGSRNYCPCPGLQFIPNGDIYTCGCDAAPKIGTVKKGITDLQYKYYDPNSGCYKRKNQVYTETK